MSGTRLRIKTDAVQFVALLGTVDADQIVEIAAALEPMHRGQLDFLDD